MLDSVLLKMFNIIHVINIGKVTTQHLLYDLIFVSIDRIAQIKNSCVLLYDKSEINVISRKLINFEIKTQVDKFADSYLSELYCCKE